MKRLTESFTLAEFEHSQVAERRGLDNRIAAHLFENVERLARTMQHIRDFLNHPVTISSGYRSAKVNEIVGGAVSSHHRSAAAADWLCPGFGTPLECARAVEPFVSMWGIGQLIAEYATAEGRGWVHTSILPVQPPNRIITIDRLGTRVGIHVAR